MSLSTEGELIGKPTLLVILHGRCDAGEILKDLQALGYPIADVAIFYRPDGTDQVIDAVTGEVAAGQSINDADVKQKQLDRAQTLVLMHPDEAQFRNVRQVFTELDPAADVQYAGATYAEGEPGGVVRQDEPVE